MEVLVVIPTFNRWDKACRSIAALGNSDFQAFQVALVEDGCTDGTIEKCESKFPWVHILHGNGELWWSGSANMGIRYAIELEADAVILLNDDNIVAPTTVGNLVEGFKRVGPRAIVCARIQIEGNEAIEWRGNPPPWHKEFSTWKATEFGERSELEIEHPPGGQAVLIPVQCFREVGLLDYDNFPMYWADHDFHYRAMRAGFKYFISRDAVIVNLPNEVPREEENLFTIRGAWWFLTNRRSPGNMKTLGRHLKTSFPGKQYLKTFYPILFRRLLWLSYGIVSRKPAIHRPLSLLKRAIVPSKKRPSSD